jgi:hypothetical protein
MQAPQWTESISSETICGYYYIMFILTCVIVAIAVFGMIGILMSKMPLMFKVSSSVQLLVSGGIAVVGAMFLYIMCDRALLGKKKEGFTAAKKQY